MKSVGISNKNKIGSSSNNNYNLSYQESGSFYIILNILNVLIFIWISSTHYSLCKFKRIHLVSDINNIQSKLIILF